MNNLTKYLLSILVGFIIGAVSGYSVYPMFNKPVEQPVEDKPTVVANEQVKDSTTSVIYYTPKDTSSGVKEKTDVELNAPNPNVIVKVNGKETEFKKLDTETQKFQDGKLVIDQTHDISFKIETTPIDNTKYWGISWGTEITKLDHQYYRLDFPVNKKLDLGGWVQHEKEDKEKTNSLGLTYRF